MLIKPYTVSNKSFEQIRIIADQLQLPIHLHIHETVTEVEDSIKQYGERPLSRLNKLGLLTPSLIGVHAVQVTNTELALLAQHGCSVAHCPTSNLKLASG